MSVNPGSTRTALACDDCEAPCAAVCAPHEASGHPATAPSTLVRLARGGPHELLAWCSSCGACEDVCPHGVAVRQELRVQVTNATYVKTLAQWRAVTPWRGGTVLLSGCTSHNITLPTAKLRRSFDLRGISDIVVSPALPCGGELDRPDQRLAEEIARAFAHVREIVVPSGACGSAIRTLLRQAGLRGRKVAVLDQWLARFGVSVPRGARHFTCCRLRRDQRDSDGASSAVWPPGPTCCGAGEPLRTAAPAVAEATAVALLRRWQEAGVKQVHVEDAACAAHLRDVAMHHKMPTAIIARTDIFIDTTPHQQKQPRGPIVR